MNVVMFVDNTLPIQTQALVELLNSLGTTVKFHAGKERLRIREHVIQRPATYQALDHGLKDEIARYDLAILGTSVPYENNYFFQGDGSAIIVSFSGWNILTDLPISNGLSYFAASIIARSLQVGSRHQENIGCINDFRWDKTGVDIALRSAYICASCMQTTSAFDGGQKAVLNDVVSILNAIANASRQHQDILQVTPPPMLSRETAFDVFLCHNTDDKPQIQQLARDLMRLGIKYWLDEEQLPPGRPWQPLLEKQIGTIRSAAVCVGTNGVGPWQDMEVRAFLTEFAKRSCPVIPVILPGAASVPELPLFLKQMMWVDLRQGDEALKRLTWAVTGRRP